MTTPKELADKAKQQIEVAQDAWHEYEVAFRADVHGEIVKATNAHNRAETALHATIDQLQAMAEAPDARWYQAIRDAARSTGYVTNSQAYEVADAVVAALATQRQAEPVDSAADEVTDAQRLDWLSANPACTITEEDGKWYVGDFEDLDADGPHNHLRQAIDAAMQKDTQ